MTYGFTYRGRDIAEFGGRLLRYSVGSPALREYEDEIVGRNGVVDYGTELGKREITVTIDIDPNEHSFKRRQSEIMSWLNPARGSGKLSFSDVPDRYYDAKLTGRLTAEQIGKYGEITLTFKAVDPYAKSEVISDSITLDSLIYLDDDFGLSDAWTFDVTAAGVLSVNNWGYEDVRPIVRVVGNFTDLIIGGMMFSGAASGTLVIDCNNYTVKLNGNNEAHRSNGRYFSLEPGINAVSVGGTALNCTVTFEFRTKYL